MLGVRDYVERERETIVNHLFTQQVSVFCSHVSNQARDHVAGGESEESRR